MRKTIIALFLALAATHIHAMGFGDMMSGTAENDCGQIGITTIFFDAHARGYFKHFDNLQAAAACFNASAVAAQIFGGSELDADADMENRLNRFYGIYRGGLHVAAGHSGGADRFRVDIIIREQGSHAYVYIVLLQDNQIVRSRRFSG